jgi:hypothetical protein
VKGEMKSFREMERRVKEYFSICETQDVFPDEAGLILHLGISEEMYEKYQTADLKRFIPFRLCIENARLKRESILVRRIFASEKRTPTGALFLVGQEENGGLTDPDLRAAAAAADKKQTLEVKMSPGVREFFD